MSYVDQRFAESVEKRMTGADIRAIQSYIDRYNNASALTDDEFNLLTIEMADIAVRLFTEWRGKELPAFNSIATKPRRNRLQRVRHSIHHEA